ncbi:hypothetical protein PILCRDRAFT_605938 [Piloderma croceum F 1598]|uniref:Uncharacterized protein n=1 Tax=Piloderma croceum (strain F 1598) TaxID=765440 RepID=A0A0C3BKP6_PILCF|nr:hypothetical protein PILCRDRAFT_605938 [Piloderma croceum F 1598]
MRAKFGPLLQLRAADGRDYFSTNINRRRYHIKQVYYNAQHQFYSIRPVFYITIQCICDQPMTTILEYRHAISTDRDEHILHRVSINIYRLGPWLRPKPSQSQPSLTALARPPDFESPSRQKPGQSRGFQAKPGRHITNSDQPPPPRNADSAVGLLDENGLTAQLRSFEHHNPLRRDNAYPYRYPPDDNLVFYIEYRTCVGGPRLDIVALVGDVYLDMTTPESPEFYYHDGNSWLQFPTSNF